MVAFDAPPIWTPWTELGWRSAAVTATAVDIGGLVEVMLNCVRNRVWRRRSGPTKGKAPSRTSGSDVGAGGAPLYSCKSARPGVGLA